MRATTHRAIAHLLVVVALVCPSAGGSEVAEASPDLVEQIDAVVDAAVSDGFAGGVAIWSDGGWLYSRVAGSSDAAGKVAVTESTLFHVASITKYFTAVAVLKAAEDGVVALGDPIDQWLASAELASRRITVDQLLAHTSGLGSSYAAESKSDAAKAVAAISKAPYDPSAAGAFRYSNDGYDLLALLLERAYDTTYEDLVSDKLSSPAELRSVGFWGRVDLTDALEVGQPLRRVSRRLRQRNYGMIGSAGLLITARDLVRFQLALKNEALLSRASLDALWAPRGSMSLGQATYGAFLIDHPELGQFLSARGYQDWGDNAILNDYLEAGVVLAVVTSKGPAEGSADERPEPFRSRIAKAIEDLLVRR